MIMRHRFTLRLIWILAIVSLIASCRPEPVDLLWVTLRVDGSEDLVQTEAITVRGLLAEQDVVLGELDRVQPGLWTDLRRGMVVVVTRVVERRELGTIPYSQRILRDESRPPGEKSVLTEGRDGDEEFIYHVEVEGGSEVRRELVDHRVITAPQPEIMVIGIKGIVPATPLPGLLAYVSGGNAWLIDGRSGEKRPLTFEGDLDGRLFSLSSDGTRLLFSRWAGDGAGDSLNTLWVTDTRLRDDPPVDLGIEGALYAQWGPGGDWFAYSTAEKKRGAPGWRAINDLWVSSANGITVTQVLEANHSGLYSWWGTSYELSPGGERMAYARASEIGVIELSDGELRPLLHFPVYHTYAEWVWLPQLSWSADGRWLAAVVHVAPQETAVVEDSPLFDLYLVDAESGESRPIAASVGMWSMPRWSPSPARLTGGEMAEIAFLRARRPLTSDESPYDLWLTDREGSFERELFSAGETEELTVPICAWSPLGNQLAVASSGDLFLVDVSGARPVALTADGLSGQPRWVLPEE
jgi:hypothetical protein